MTTTGRHGHLPMLRKWIRNLCSVQPTGYRLINSVNSESCLKRTESDIERASGRQAMIEIMPVRQWMLLTEGSNSHLRRSVLGQSQGGLSTGEPLLAIEMLTRQMQVEQIRKAVEVERERDGPTEAPVALTGNGNPGANFECDAASAPAGLVCFIVAVADDDTGLGSLQNFSTSDRALVHT